MQPIGPYIFLRLIPTRASRIGGDRETYRIAQAHLRPMQGTRSAHWSVGRHETGTVAFVPDPKAPQIALDAAELFLSGEIWANDFYFLDPHNDRFKEYGFSFVATGAVEEILIATLRNFMEISKVHTKIELPVKISAGLVGAQNYRLAVDRNYFAFSEFEGRILRSAVIQEMTIGDWATDPFQLLKPLFEDIYDAAGLKRPDTHPGP